MTAAAGWRLEQRRGDVRSLHDPWPGPSDLGERLVAVCEPTATAVVLGSTQSDTVVDGHARRAADAVVVRRGSGGGAVLVVPLGQVWIDVWVPHDDPLWEEDVVVAPQWMGDVWASALASLGVAATSVHRGRPVVTEWSPLVCFAGVGPGEVSVGGRKVVGLSQRRTRHGARISTVALRHWHPAALAALLALTDDERHRLVSDVAHSVYGLVEVLARDDTAPAARDDTAPAARDDTAPAARDDTVLSSVTGAVLAHLPARR